MLKPGDPVPEFAFASELFGSISQASLRGKRYVIYFYPKDDTPGCTREACAFRDNLPKFGSLGVKVFGVSADDEKSHIRFSRKHSLNFKLIPDPDHEICEAFGTWIEKSMYGRSYMGVARSTFVVGPDGKIEKVWEKVVPDGHAEEVFAWLNGDPIPVLPAKPKLPVPAVIPAYGKTAAAGKPAVVVKSTALELATSSKPVARPVAKLVEKGKILSSKKAKSKSAARELAARKSAKKPMEKPVKKATKTVKVSRVSKKTTTKLAPKSVSKKVTSKKPVLKKATRTFKVVKKSVNTKKTPIKPIAKKSAGKKLKVKKLLAKKPAAKKVRR